MSTNLSTKKLQCEFKHLNANMEQSQSVYFLFFLSLSWLNGKFECFFFSRLIKNIFPRFIRAPSDSNAKPIEQLYPESTEGHYLHLCYIDMLFYSHQHVYFSSLYHVIP